MLGVAATCATLGAFGCNDSITSRWKQREAKQPRCSMTAGSDGTGKAEWVYLNSNTGDTIQTDLFELEWEESGAGTCEVVLEGLNSSLAALPPEWDEHDGTMSCELDGSSKMDCTASEPWENVTFEFERDEGGDDEPSNDDESH